MFFNNIKLRLNLLQNYLKRDIIYWFDLISTNTYHITLNFGEI